MPRLAKTWRIVVVSFAILIAFAYCYRFRLRIRAKSWHLVHGDSVVVATYRVHVPADWLVERLATQDVALWNIKTGEAILLRSHPKLPSFTAQSWSDLQNRLNDPKNPIVAKRDLRFGGEPFTCFERAFEVTLPPSQPKYVAHLPSSECESDGPLDVMIFAGMKTNSADAFSDSYSLMSAIQRNSN